MTTQSLITKLRVSRNEAVKNHTGIGQSSTTLNKLVDIAESLAQKRKDIDPTLSPERAANLYAQAHEKGTKAAHRLIDEGLESISKFEFEQASRAKIESRFEMPSNAVEIRQALLRLDQVGRDKAIKQAAMEGRADILAALHCSPDWLYGGSTTPIADHVETAFDKALPGYRENMEKAEQAKRNLYMAAENFSKLSDGLRDLGAEQRAKDGQRRAQEADAKLDAAIG